MADPNQNKAAPTKSSKFADAVKGATGQEIEVVDPNKAGALDLQKMGFGGSDTLLKKYESGKDAAVALDALAKSGDFEFAPQLFKLEENDEIRGILEGNGPAAEFEKMDKLTGEVKTTIVQTWIIATADGSKRISILSSVQLDRKLPPFVGGPVVVYRGKDINIADGRRVTDYLVAGPKKPNGERRSWATRPVIDAASEAKQLPAGEDMHENLIDGDRAHAAPAAS